MPIAPIPREKANEIRPNLPALSGIKNTHG